MIKIGHKGAAALAPENTLRSLELAVEAGVDMVEVDVLDLADGTLVLAHSDELARAAAAPLPTLDDALVFARERGVGVQLDLKRPGYEREVVAALRGHGLVERAVVSSCHAASVRALGAEEPMLRRAFTYPFDRHGISQRRLTAAFVRPSLAVLRTTLPPRLARMLERADATVATLHYLVISRAAVARCHALGIPVYAWTVDDPEAVRALARAGVDAIITNDPRIFAATFQTTCVRA